MYEAVDNTRSEIFLNEHAILYKFQAKHICSMCSVTSILKNPFPSVPCQSTRNMDNITIKSKRIQLAVCLVQVCRGMAALLVDLSKAFDAMPHGIVFTKRNACGMFQETVSLLGGYLRIQKKRGKGCKL